jgi:hypothetical protein
MVKKLLEHNTPYYDMIAARRNFLGSKTPAAKTTGFYDMAIVRGIGKWIPGVKFGSSHRHVGPPRGLTGAFMR